MKCFVYKNILYFIKFVNIKKISKGTQDVEALSDEGFGESSTIERMEKDGTLTNTHVNISPKKKQEDDQKIKKHVDKLSNSSQNNDESPSKSK